MGKNLRRQEKKKAQKTQIICICEKKAVPLHAFWLLRAMRKGLEENSKRSRYRYPLPQVRSLY